MRSSPKEPRSLREPSSTGSSGVPPGGELGTGRHSGDTLRRRLLPALAGHSDKRHVALTYDGGPDPVSTSKFLDLLEQAGRATTFFRLDEHIESNGDLVRDISRSSLGT